MGRVMVGRVREAGSGWTSLEGQSLWGRYKGAGIVTLGQGE